MKISQGFTLIEMSMVLIIIGFLIGGMFVPLSMQMSYQKIKKTQNTLETIKEALMGFAIINNRLPCPALDNKGNEVITNPCTTYNETDGYLPWANLGTDRFDAWGHPFRYRVDGNFTANIPNPPNTINLIIQDNSSPSNLLSSSNVVAIIYSCGKNGIPDATNDSGSYSGANCSSPSSPATNNTYTQDFYVENKFDDILVWLPKTILINQLVLAGKWPP